MIFFRFSTNGKTPIQTMGQFYFWHERWMISSDCEKKDIISKYKSLKGKHGNEPTMFTMSSEIFNSEIKDSYNLLGHLIILDLDKIDLATSINIVEYISNKYKINEKKILVKTNKGYHLYILKIVSFSELLIILNDPIIQKYDDPLHIKLTTVNGCSQIRLSSDKFGSDNRLEKVWESGECQNEIEEEIQAFLERFL